MEKMSLLLKKERLCLQGEGNNRKFCHSDAARFFFSFFIKGQKKTCYKMFFFVSGIVFATEGMKIYLFHLRSCMFR